MIKSKPKCTFLINYDYTKNNQRHVVYAMKEKYISNLRYMIEHLTLPNTLEMRELIGEGQYNKVVSVKTLEKVRAARTSHDINENPLVLNINETLQDNHLFVTNLTQIEDTSYLKLFDGSLNDLIKSGVTPNQLKSIAFQLCQALQFLKDNKLVHLDIKPGNILYKKRGNKIEIALCDLDGVQEVDENGERVNKNIKVMMTSIYLNSDKDTMDNNFYNDSTAAFLTLLELYLQKKMPVTNDENEPVNEFAWVMTFRKQWEHKELIKLPDELKKILPSIKAGNYQEVMDLYAEFDDREKKSKDYYFFDNFSEYSYLFTQDQQTILNLYTTRTQNFIIGAQVLLHAIQNEEFSGDFDNYLENYANALSFILKKESFDESFKNLLIDVNASLIDVIDKYDGFDQSSFTQLEFIKKAPDAIKLCDAYINDPKSGKPHVFQRLKALILERQEVSLSLIQDFLNQNQGNNRNMLLRKSLFTSRLQLKEVDTLINLCRCIENLDNLSNREIFEKFIVGGNTKSTHEKRLEGKLENIKFEHEKTLNSKEEPTHHQVIDNIVNNFNYQKKFTPITKPLIEGKFQIYTSDKHKALGEGTLARVKAQIAKNFLTDVLKLKDNNYISMNDFYEDVTSLINKAEDECLKARTGEVERYNPSGYRIIVKKS
jgi:serine/threonine protein kinase